MKYAKLKIYLDVCTLCRPYDDQSFLRIKLETDAYYLILENIKNAKYTMISSAVHLSEIKSIESDSIKSNLLSMLDKYSIKPILELDVIRKRTDNLIDKGFGIGDAAHIAFAESSADYFITCDDKLIKKALKSSLNIAVLNPVQFCVMKDLK